MSLSGRERVRAFSRLSVEAGNVATSVV